MKRFFVALLVGGMVFAGVFALAASLNVDGGTIQAGSDVDLTCDGDGVNVDGWGLETDDGKVSFVRIHNIDPDCSGDDIFVNITKYGTKIAGGSATIPNNGDAGDNDPDANQVGVKISFTPQYAWDITDITVFIEGP
jgi:hypothetical protein